MQQITPENWNYCQYVSGDLRALITYGAEPGPDGEGVTEVFAVTTTDEEYREIFQKRFYQLDQACLTINQMYGHFVLDDRGAAETAGGCSSCSNK